MSNDEFVRERESLLRISILESIRFLNLSILERSCIKMKKYLIYLYFYIIIDN